MQLIFDEIGVVLDRDQYRDILSLLDMYHVYLRQHQVGYIHFLARLFLLNYCSIGSTDRVTRSLSQILLKPGSNMLEVPYLQR